MKSNFDYDMKNDILYIYKKRTARGSINMGDFTIDISHHGKLSGLEINNASKIISKFTENRITKKMLKNIKKATIKAEYKQNTMYIYYAVLFSMKNKMVRDSLPVPMPVTLAHS